VDSEQILVLGLLVLAFIAGWIARGSQISSNSRGDKEPAKEPSPTAAAAENGDAFAGADAALERARLAGRAAEAVAPIGGRASEAALGVLDKRLEELEEWVDRLESELGEDDPRFTSYDREVDVLVGVRRRLGDTGRVYD
jgi:hypothetical protein